MYDSQSCYNKLFKGKLLGSRDNFKESYLIKMNLNVNIKHRSFILDCFVMLCSFLLIIFKHFTLNFRVQIEMF